MSTETLVPAVRPGFDLYNVVTRDAWEYLTTVHSAEVACRDADRMHYDEGITVKVVRKEVVHTAGQDG